MSKLREIKNILQTTPKGSYYEDSNEMLEEMLEKFRNLLEEDRSLFSAISLLPSTDYAKGVISHYLLNNSIGDDVNDYPLMYNWSSDIEDRIILHSLRNMGYARAIKNSMMMAGREDGIEWERVNNTRTRKIILNYIFGRDDDSLQYLTLKFRNKMKKLIRHALGYADLMKIINNEGRGDWKRRFKKYFTPIEDTPEKYFSYNRVVSVLGFLFNKDIEIAQYFEGFAKYKEIVKKAKEEDEEGFIEIVRENSNLFPTEVLEGLIGGFQLNIDLNEAMNYGNMTDSQKVQRKRTSESRDTKSVNTKRDKEVDLDIDYKNQSLYDLLKMMFARKKHNEKLSEDLLDAIEYRIEKEKIDIDLGDNVVVILDNSDSMKGSDERPLHPFINALSTAYTLESDEIVEVNEYAELSPSGNTNLAKALLRAVKNNPEMDTVVVVSDGYENTIKGMFEKVYNKLKELGYDFGLIHINPVQTSDIDSIKLTDETEPIMIENNRMLETHFALSLIENKPEVARQMFIEKMKEKLGGGLNYERLER